jgi:hypothetical protein
VKISSNWCLEPQKLTEMSPSLTSLGMKRNEYQCALFYDETHYSSILHSDIW